MGCVSGLRNRSRPIVDSEPPRIRSIQWRSTRRGWIRAGLRPGLRRIEIELFDSYFIMTRNERFDKLTTDDSQFTSPAQFGNNVLVGEDSNGNPYLEELTNNNRATLQPDGTFDTSAVATEQAVINGAAPQFALDGYVVPVASGLSSNDAIDPSATTTPVQDAIDAIGRTNGGAILLPPKEIQETGPILGSSFKTILGWGTSRRSTIKITDTAADAIGQDPDVARDCRRSYWHNLTIVGGDQSSRTAGSAINLDLSGNKPRGMNLGSVRFISWGGPDPVINFDPGGAFELFWDYLEIASFEGKAVQIFEGGLGMRVGNLVVTSDPSNTGRCIDFQSGGESQFGHISMMNHGGAGFFAKNTSLSLQVGQLHFENGSGSDVSTGSPVFFIGDSECCNIGTIRTVGSSNGGSITVDSIVELAYRNSGHIIRNLVPNAYSTVNTNLINITSDPAGPSWYFGPASDIDVNHSDSKEGEVRSLDSAGTGSG